MFETEIMTAGGTPLNVSVLVNNKLVHGVLVCEAEPARVMTWAPDLHSIYNDEPIAVRFKPWPGQVVREET
jgi:hypothetical protein